MCVQEKFKVSKIMDQKNVVQKSNESKIEEKILVPKQMLPAQISLWQLSIMKEEPGNIITNFGQILWVTA